MSPPPGTPWGTDPWLDRQRRDLHSGLWEGVTLTRDQMTGLGHHFFNYAFKIQKKTKFENATLKVLRIRA